MRPAGPAFEAGCILKGPRARVTRGDGTETKWRTGKAGCGPAGRAYKGAPPTPIFRGSALKKAGGPRAAVQPTSCLNFLLRQGSKPEGRAPLRREKRRSVLTNEAYWHSFCPTDLPVLTMSRLKSRKGNGTIACR